MASERIKKRVDRLLKAHTEWDDVLDLIRAGRKYSELTDTQKERYCRYFWNNDRKTVEDVHKMVTGESLDFVLRKRAPPRTEAEEKEQIRAATAEIEKIIERMG